MATPTTRLGICQYLGFIFASYCVLQNQEVRVQRRSTDNFEVDFQWSFLNYTWPNQEIYVNAIYSRAYIPENNVPAGIKIYKDRMFMALPRIRPGTPVTLAYVSTQKKRINPLLTPYPSWEMNVRNNCVSLQSVQSMEIDRRGIMWVLDGMRINSFSKCPCKLVLFDLNNGGKIVQSYTFKDEICLHEGGFLNDIVIDESDGGYAYITDNSDIDPGLIVFSKQQSRVWKIRDATMFAEIDASNFTVDGVRVLNLGSIDGISLSPLPKGRNEERLVYYSSLIGRRMYAISTRILRNEAFCKTATWRRFIKLVGTKPDSSDGMIIDNQGNMYFGLLASDGVSKWNIYQSFDTATEIYSNHKELIWPDSFGTDSQGCLNLLANQIHKYFDKSISLNLTNDVKFRTFKYCNDTKSYLYSGN